MFIAEREGFEPPVPLGTAVFKTAVIDHSTISPLSPKELYSLKALQRYNFFLILQNYCLVFPEIIVFLHP